MLLHHNAAVTEQGLGLLLITVFVPTCIQGGLCCCFRELEGTYGFRRFLGDGYGSEVSILVDGVLAITVLIFYAHFFLIVGSLTMIFLVKLATINC